MKPYLKKLMYEHRLLNRLIDTTKAMGAQHELRDLNACGFASRTGFLSCSVIITDAR